MTVMAPRIVPILWCCNHLGTFLITYESVRIIMIILIFCRKYWEIRNVERNVLNHHLMIFPFNHRSARSPEIPGSSGFIFPILKRASRHFSSDSFGQPWIHAWMMDQWFNLINSWLILMLIIYHVVDIFDHSWSIPADSSLKIDPKMDQWISQTTGPAGIVCKILQP